MSTYADLPPMILLSPVEDSRAPRELVTLLYLAQWCLADVRYVEDNSVYCMISCVFGVATTFFAITASRLSTNTGHLQQNNDIIR